MTIYANTTHIQSLTNLIRLEIPHASTKDISRFVSKCYELYHYIYMYFDKHAYNNFKNINTKHLITFKIRLKSTLINYNQLLSFLEQSNMIQINNTYSSDNFSKSYRIFNDTNISKESVRVTIDTEKLFKNALTLQELKKKNKSNKAVLTQIKNMCKFSIDLEQYEHYLTENKNKLIKITKNNYNKSQKNIFLDENKISALLIQALKINMKLFFCVQSQENRIYSSFSNLNKLALPFLKQKNSKALSEIDVKNCQPLFLSALFDNKDLKLQAEKGQFYESFMDDNNDRDTIKKMFMQILFGNKSLTSNQKSIIDNKFSGFSDFLIQYRHTDLRDDKLFHKLQMMESNIFCNKLHTFCIDNNIDFITRHDSVIVTNEYADTVQSFIKMTIFDEYNITATLTNNPQNTIFIENQKRLEYLNS